MSEVKWRANCTKHEEWRLTDATPYHQTISSECPGCGEPLHYSSGWDRRVCDLCGFVEGMKEYRVYPRGCSFEEFHFMAGQVYFLRRQRLITAHEADEIIVNISPYGSFYRPPLEND